MAKPPFATSPAPRTTRPLARASARLPLPAEPAVQALLLGDDEPTAVDVRPLAHGQIAIAQPSVPLGLAAELLSAFAHDALSEEDMAATVLRLGQPTAGWRAAGTDAEASGGAEAIGVAEQFAGHGRASEAEALLRQALIHQITREGRDTKAAFALELALAGHLAQHDAVAEAKRLLVSLIERQRATLGPRHLDTLCSLEQLGLLLVEQNELGYAEPLLCEVVLVRRNVLGDDDTQTLAGLSALARLLTAQGKPNEAEPLLRRTLRWQTERLGEASEAAMASRAALAQALLLQGNVADGEALLHQNLRIARRTRGVAHEATLLQAILVGGFLLDAKRPAEARRLLGDAYAIAEKMCVAKSSLRGRLRALLGAAQRRLGNWPQAETHLIAAYDALRETVGLAHVATQRALSDLIALYTAWGKPQAAAPFRAVHAQCS